MRIHPFTCIRPAVEEGTPHAGTRNAETLQQRFATRNELDAALASGELMLDAGRAIYICEGHDTRHGTWTGVICCCGIDDMEDGTVSCSERLRPASIQAFEREVAGQLARIDEMGAHDEPVTLVHETSPALDMLLAAMKTATPLYRPHGLIVWRVSRPEAIEALEAIYAPMKSQVTDERSHLLAEAAEQLCLRERAARSVMTGREPFNVFPALLVAAGGPMPEAPAIPAGLLIHPLF